MGLSFLIKTFFNLFLADLGLCCCRGFSVVMEIGGSSLLVVHGFLTAVAPRVVEHGLSSCGSWALGHRPNSCGIQS